MVLCVDFGSTFTKAALVDAEQAVLVGTAQHRTTIDTDVLDGFAACRDELVAAHPEAAGARTLACSSAGGGLRIAVVGNEPLVTAEAGRRVALSSGGAVVAVLGRDDLGESFDAALAAARADVVLLTGGTDGGDEEALLDAAGALAASSWDGPVVLAGNVEARDQVLAILGRLPVEVAGNVVPRIGVLAPESAREAIRAVFLRHVIGGKHLSASDDFAAMVLGATPDVVLLGVELLAEANGSTTPGAGVAVVDVGGATTDVHTVVVGDPEETSLAREVVAPTAVTRTVEGDLGMRWSAATTAAAAAEAGLDLGIGGEVLADAARRRTTEPGLLAGDDEERAVDEALATAAVVLAVRRHAGRAKVVLAPDGRVVERTGKDLRAVDLVVGSGGVLRAAGDALATRVLGAATGHDPDGWQLPETPRLVVDRRTVLAAAGLLALSGMPGGTDVARRLISASVSA
ncbi:MAG: glutamate mutase L [Nocardioidaceae bacterium]|nr:glutamate mutase L [Nocardioidaceae bacterium]